MKNVIIKVPYFVAAPVLLIRKIVKAVASPFATKFFASPDANLRDNVFG